MRVPAAFAGRRKLRAASRARKLGGTEPVHVRHIRILTWKNTDWPEKKNRSSEIRGLAVAFLWTIHQHSHAGWFTACRDDQVSGG
jgi:hypothetical protein